MNVFTQTIAAAVLCTLATAQAVAQTKPDKGPAGQQTAGRQELVTGEVRRINKEQKSVTLSHEPIPHLDMPAMSMAFKVREASMLDRLSVGDKVRFRAEKVDDAFYVTAIEK